MTGTVLFSTTERISPAPPRGISTSKYRFCFMSSIVASRDKSSTSSKQSGSIPHASSEARIDATIA